MFLLLFFFTLSTTGTFILASCRVGLIRSIAIDGVMCYSLSTFSLISGLSCNIYHEFKVNCVMYLQRK